MIDPISRMGNWRETVTVCHFRQIDPQTTPQHHSKGKQQKNNSHDVNEFVKDVAWMSGFHLTMKDDESTRHPSYQGRQKGAHPLHNKTLISKKKRQMKVRNKDTIFFFSI